MPFRRNYELRYLGLMVKLCGTKRTLKRLVRTNSRRIRGVRCQGLDQRRIPTSKMHSWRPRVWALFSRELEFSIRRVRQDPSLCALQQDSAARGRQMGLHRKRG